MHIFSHTTHRNSIEKKISRHLSQDFTWNEATARQLSPDSHNAPKRRNKWGGPAEQTPFTKANYANRANGKCFFLCKATHTTETHTETYTRPLTYTRTYKHSHVHRNMRAIIHTQADKQTVWIPADFFLLSSSPSPPPTLLCWVLFCLFCLLFLNEKKNIFYLQDRKQRNALDKGGRGQHSSRNNVADPSRSRKSRSFNHVQQRMCNKRHCPIKRFPLFYEYCKYVIRAK